MQKYTRMLVVITSLLFLVGAVTIINPFGSEAAATFEHFPRKAKVKVVNGMDSPVPVSVVSQQTGNGFFAIATVDTGQIGDSQSIDFSEVAITVPAGYRFILEDVSAELLGDVEFDYPPEAAFSLRVIAPGSGIIGVGTQKIFQIDSLSAPPPRLSFGRKAFLIANEGSEVICNWTRNYRVADEEFGCLLTGRLVDVNEDDDKDKNKVKNDDEDDHKDTDGELHLFLSTP